MNDDKIMRVEKPLMSVHNKALGITRVSHFPHENNHQSSSIKRSFLSEALSL